MRYQQKITALFGCVMMSGAALAGNFHCASYCNTPTYFTDPHIVTSADLPMHFAEGKTLRDAYQELTKECKKVHAKAVPLRIVDAPAVVQTQMRIILVPAIPKEICMADGRN